MLARRGFWAALATVVVAGSAVVVSQASADQKKTVDLKKWYLLVNRNSGKVLDDHGSAKNDGAAMVQWSRNGGVDQQWRFVDSGDGYYRLQNRSSGKVLDDLGWSKTAGSALVQWSDLNGTNQQFKLAKSSNGYVRLVNRFSGMAVGVKSAAKANGRKIVQNRDRAAANQQWKLVEAGSVGNTGNPGGSGSTPTPSASAPASQVPSSTPTSPSTSPAATNGTSAKSFMGSDKVLIGGSMTEASFKAAPFDVRYAYIHSQPAPSSEAYTAAKCKAEWSSWWGCWGGTSTAPGNQVTWQDAEAAKATYQGKSRPQKYLWTWYSLRDLGDAAGEGDGPGEVKAINRTDLLTKYLNDYRFFLQKIGTSHDAIDLEPDFWGFARTLGNLHQVPAQVKASNPTDCGSQENSASGLAQCLISMGHKYAPNTAVGLHLSCFDWETDVQKCEKDYADLGAKNADFLVTDVSDRDAGWYAQPEHGGSDHFWNDQKAAASLKFWKTMAESVGKPVVLWQIPVGNMSGNNTSGHYKDDKVDWFFSHMNQVADAHIAGLLFGAGWTEQTTPETDGGNLFKKTIANYNSGGTPLK
ncbi:RICIN domain-containing protein [Streptomyces canus]|uniref:RICIN domain-containing protein n=1 Tax=Streptomyces canus TaxID=58343 RepID=UPI0036A7B8EB